MKKPFRERDYFAHEHVIVSYNGVLRGVVEDTLQKARLVRCSVSSFNNVVVDGTALLATVPKLVATLAGTPLELLWSAANDDDPAGTFVREKIAQIVSVSRAGRRAAPTSAGS